MGKRHTQKERFEMLLNSIRKNPMKPQSFHSKGLPLAECYKDIKAMINLNMIEMNGKFVQEVKR